MDARARTGAFHYRKVAVNRWTIERVMGRGRSWGMPPSRFRCIGATIMLPIASWERRFILPTLMAQSDDAAIAAAAIAAAAHDAAHAAAAHDDAHTAATNATVAHEAVTIAAGAHAAAATAANATVAAANDAAAHAAAHAADHAAAGQSGGEVEVGSGENGSGGGADGQSDEAGQGGVKVEVGSGEDGSAGGADGSFGMMLVSSTHHRFAGLFTIRKPGAPPVTQLLVRGSPA